MPLAQSRAAPPAPPPVKFPAPSGLQAKAALHAIAPPPVKWNAAVQMKPVLRWNGRPDGALSAPMPSCGSAVQARGGIFRTASPPPAGRSGSIQMMQSNFFQQSGVQFPVLNPTQYRFTLASAQEAITPTQRGESATITGLGSGSGVEVGDVASYKIVQFLEKKGDKLTGDHQPSGAAIKEAIRILLHQKLNHVLTRTMAKNAYAKAITIVVTDAWHKSESRTYGGRNSAAKISSDAADLATAAMEDFKQLVGELLASGFSKEEVQIMYDGLDEARTEFFSTGKMQYVGFDSNRTVSWQGATLSNTNRCQETTSAGTQCTRTPDFGSGYCWQHK